MDYTIFFNGGIGKHICGTTLLRHIQSKDKDAKLIVVSGFPEVFMHNPRVHRNLHHMTSYIFDDYIDGTDLRAGEPYSMIEYYHGKEHINKLFPKSFRFPDFNEDIYPEIYLSPDELRAAEDMIKQSDKPIITFQPTGGNQKVGQAKDPRSFTGRDLTKERAQKIVDLLKDKYNVLHIRLPHEYALEGVRWQEAQIRQFISLMPYTRAHIGIDSVMMHAAAAFKKPGLIFWGNTNIKNLGYPHFFNVFRDKCPTPMCGRPHVGIADIVPEGGWICPYGQVCNKYEESEIEEYITQFIEKELSKPAKFKL
jgi:hypothetical protein